jgi:Tol biopolymer transport system component
VYFSSNRDGMFDVWKTHWETGREARITTGGGMGAAESPDGRRLYYVKQEPSSGYGLLWRRPVEGGRDELVLGEYRIAYRGFALLNDAVYFISDDEASAGNALFLLQLGSGAVTRIAPLANKKASSFVACPEITPDGRRIFYTVAEEKGYDLVVVENFR